MSSQLLTFGICMALGHPLVYVWLVLAELALVIPLVRRGERLVPETEGVA
jgi:hypothetical protein